MTEQNCRPEPARLAISAPLRYPRAGARVDRDPAPGDPARARFVTDPPESAPEPGPGHSATPRPEPPPRPAGTAPGERLPNAAGQQRYANGRYAPYPLARRALRISDLGHDAVTAAHTRRDRLAAACDYSRSATKTAGEAGMSHAASETDLDRVTADLVAVTDRLVAAMCTWRPQP